jgi:hypothetical protein
LCISLITDCLTISSSGTKGVVWWQSTVILSLFIQLICASQLDIEQTLSRKELQYKLNNLVDFPYFGLNHNQRGYILLTEAYFNRCSKSINTVCPHNMAIYSTQTVTCESSLFFQNTDGYNICRKNLLISYYTPTQRCYGSIWMYHFV